MATSSLFQPITLCRRLPLSTSTAASLIAPRCLHEGPDTVEELLEQHPVKNSPRDDEEDEFAAGRWLTSMRREALGLYHDILRAMCFFTWPDACGIPWRDVLRENACHEFEEARFECDPNLSNPSSLLYFWW